MSYDNLYFIMFTYFALLDVNNGTKDTTKFISNFTLTLILLEPKVISLCHQYWVRPACISVQLNLALYSCLTNFKMDNSKNGKLIIPFKKFSRLRVKCNHIVLNERTKIYYFKLSPKLHQCYVSINHKYTLLYSPIKSYTKLFNQDKILYRYKNKSAVINKQIHHICTKQSQLCHLKTIYWPLRTFCCR